VVALYKSPPLSNKINGLDPLITKKRKIMEEIESRQEPIDPDCLPPFEEDFERELRIQNMVTAIILFPDMIAGLELRNRFRIK